MSGKRESLMGSKTIRNKAVRPMESVKFNLDLKMFSLQLRLLFASICNNLFADCLNMTSERTGICRHSHGNDVDSIWRRHSKAKRDPLMFICLMTSFTIAVTFRICFVERTEKRTSNLYPFTSPARSINEIIILCCSWTNPSDENKIWGRLRVSSLGTDFQVNFLTHSACQNLKLQL